MSDSKDLLLVSTNINITAQSLQAIVANAKKISGKDEKGIYRVDTADKVSEMVSKFLLENDFEGFVQNPDNY